MSAGWLPAKMLQAGMTLVNRDNEQTLKVVNQTKLDKTDTVYNFEVDEFHTYHIGEFGVWVHNSCGIFGNTANATQAARNLGYSKVKQYPFNSHGQPVYKKGNRYITPDVDIHNGGVWKVFDRKGNRIGTADKHLNIFKD